MKPGDIVPEASSFQNFKMTFLGYNVIKFSSFKINNEAEFALNPGKDGEAASWTVKKFKRDLDVTVQAEELKPLIQIAPGGDLLKLPPAPIVAESVIEGVGTLKFEIPAAKIIGYPFEFKEGQDKVDVPVKLGLTSYPIVTFEG